jgi:HAD superfamily hydrolase (TIGR01509 family)
MSSEPIRRTQGIRAVLFDFDGTLTEPGALDFPAIKAAIGCPPHSPILEFIPTLASQSAREKARLILDRFEMQAARQSRANAGAEEVVQALRALGLKIGIFSRNSLSSIRRALENFTRISAADFDAIVSRDDCLAPKPSPEAVFAAAQRMGVRTDQILVVGDFVFDVQAGREAGSQTVLLTNSLEARVCETAPDYTIAGLSELAPIVRRLLPRAGR